MTLLIRGGTVVTADESRDADILCEDGKIQAVGKNLSVPSKTEVIDAKHCYVMPGGIDPHTHMQMPFMGTVASEDFYTGTAAALAGGTTMIIDFVIPSPGERLMDAYKKWRDWAEKACADYSFHVAVTWWDESVHEDMGQLVNDCGVNSFKHFMAYKGSIMADDGVMVNSFPRALELGALVTAHAENGDLVDYLQKEIYKRGVAGPEGHPASRPPAVEGEAANRVIRIAQVLGVPLYLVHNSCRQSVEAIARAHSEGQRVFGECLVQHLMIDESVYHNKDWNFAAAHVMSPPFRPKTHQQIVWDALRGGILQTTATDHCCFCSDQKELGRENFAKIPNGTSGVEDRLSMLWHHGVNTGRLTPNEFVAVTSTNAARIFNIYPKKGALKIGSDADIVVWNPQAKKRISVETHHQNIDFNVFEGQEVIGSPAYTISGGIVKYADGKLKVEQGMGHYVDRPPFAQYFGAAQRWNDMNRIQAVQRGRNNKGRRRSKKAESVS